MRVADSAGGPAVLSPRRRWWWLTAALVALPLLFLASRPPRPAPDPAPGSFAFAVLGDAPYYEWEVGQYRRVLRQLDASKLDFVLHVGDIFWHPCTDPMYRSRLAYFQSLRHPVIYTPGDNEWADCHERGSGAYAPLTRIARIREIFFSDPTRSLGGRALPLISQGGEETYKEFVENARWEHRGIVFATVHLVGSTNGLKSFPGRTEADDAESRRRTAAATAWLREAFATARASRARAVFVACHADLNFDLPLDHPERTALEPFVAALEEESETFPGPVVIAHGDSHKFIVDHPLVRRTTGKRLDNVTRLEVPGSPKVGWVRAVATPEASEPFRFEAYVVPRWQVW